MKYSSYTDFQRCNNKMLIKYYFKNHKFLFHEISLLNHYYEKKIHKRLSISVTVKGKRLSNADKTGRVLQMWTSKLNAVKKLWFFGNYDMSARTREKEGICTLIEKWRYFVSRVRARSRVRIRIRVRAGVSVNTFSIKCSRSGKEGLRQFGNFSEKKGSNFLRFFVNIFMNGSKPLKKLCTKIIIQINLQQQYSYSTKRQTKLAPW